MECKVTKMELLPVLRLLPLLLLSFITFTSGQTDDNLYRSAARSFSQPDTSGLRVGRTTNRRNLFFPPPDRLSPTLRPILSIHEVTKTSTEKPVISLSRFHPTSRSKYSPTSTKETVQDYDEAYYDYYDEYYDEKPNTTTSSFNFATNKPKSIPVSKQVSTSTSSKFDKPLAPFSKFQTGNFRFSSPKRENTFELTSRRTSTTTKSPFRFRFTPAEENERTTKPTRVGTTQVANNRKGSLADLIAKLKSQLTSNSSPTSNDVDNRDGRSFEEPKVKVSVSTSASKDTSDLRLKITNSTESTFSVGSVKSSQSIKSKVEPNSGRIFAYHTTIAPVSTTDPYFLSGFFYETTPQTNQNFDSDRIEGKRVLENDPPKENLYNDIPEPEGPPVTNSYPSLFENIQIAVDPSLLPPGYSVEKTITETAPEEYEEAKEPLPAVHTTTLKPETTTFSSSLATIGDASSSLAQEDVTSFLPLDYSSSSKNPFSKSTTVKLPTTTEKTYKSKVENIPASTPKEIKTTSTTSTTPAISTTTTTTTTTSKSSSTSTTSTTEKISSAVKTLDVFSFLPTGYKNKSETKAEKSELPSLPISTVDVSSFLPSGYNEQSETQADKNELPILPVSTIDASSFLPPGYKPSNDQTKKEDKIPGIKVKSVDLSNFLPPGYKEKVESTAKKSLPEVELKEVDVSSFLPPGYKAPADDKEEEKDDLPGVPVSSVDVSKFLPPGYNSGAEAQSTTTTESSMTTKKSRRFTLALPKKKKKSESQESTTGASITKKPKPSGPPPIKPKFKNIFDRIKSMPTTKYVPSFVTPPPKSGKKGGSANAPKLEPTTTTSTTTTTTTTQPTTTTPPRPTTPGICGSNCRLTASLRLVSGTNWQPELANRDTLEFQELANHIETELDAFYRGSSFSQWYDQVEVDSFNPFHPDFVIVWYFLSLVHIKADIDTSDLKERLNTDLQVVSHSVGKYTVDPEGTDFIVYREPQVLVQENAQNFLIPEWLIAVIVIGLASFLFILIFGVVALVSRAKVRKRAKVPLTEEFLNNLNLQVNGIDNYAMDGLHDMDHVWSEKYSEKAIKPPSSRGKGFNPEYNVNIYDSWRTDYSGPYTSSSANQSKRRSDLDFEGKQFYKDDPYDF